MPSKLMLNVRARGGTGVQRARTGLVWADHGVLLARRGSLSPVWRRNQAAQDAE